MPAPLRSRALTLFAHKPHLLVAFRDGDPEALGEVFRVYVDAVNAVIRNGCRAGEHGRVGGVGDAGTERDLVHEVFRRAFSPSARSAFDGRRPYRPYLLTIARNVLIDHWRRRGREEAASALEEAELEDPDSGRIEEDLDFRAQLRVTRAFLERLTDDERELVRLRFEEELSQHELAERLGVSRWQVRARERSLRRRLRKHLLAAGVVER